MSHFEDGYENDNEYGYENANGYEQASASTDVQDVQAEAAENGMEAGGSTAGQPDRRDAVKGERVKKEKTGRRNSPVQLVLLSLVSSILGASIVFSAFTLVPAAWNRSAASSTAAKTGGSDLNVTSVGTNKTVTIEQSSSAVSAVAEKAGPSVVGIKVTIPAQQSDFFFGNSGEGTGEGSGIIISEDGYILTNNHVIEDALVSGTNELNKGGKIEVILPNQTDKSYTATLVGRDSESDLAVLKIQAAGLTKAEFGDSDSLKAGELAVAIGNPGGLDYMGSVTAGIVSGLNRTIEVSDGKELHLIQTDAAINPGNSGGALCNAAGQVIGINTVKISATGYEGLGFAIPINSAKEIAQDLINYKYVKGRPLLGVSINQQFNSEVAKNYNVPEGLLVADVTTYGPAEKAGIKSGDIITGFDGKEVKTFSELDAQKDTHKPGDKVVVEVYRDGKTLKLTVTLGEEKI
jgi:serine protease Do